MSKEADQVARVKALRGGNRSVITKLEKEALDLIQGRDEREKGDRINRLGSIKVTLREKRKLLKELDGKVSEHCAIEELAKESEETADWEMRIYEVLCKIDDFQKGDSNMEDVGTRASASITPVRARRSQTPPDVSPVTVQNVSSPSRSSSSNGNYATGIKLPKIQLAKFNGDITKFPAFWQSFEHAIHNNEAVSPINKLNYLLSLLEGPAYRAVEGFNLQEENYENVVETLKSRFGKKQQIVNAHMQNLLELQNHPSEGIGQLRKIYDK